MKLTQAQINFFNTFGYLGFPGLMADRAAIAFGGGVGGAEEYLSQR